MKMEIEWTCALKQQINRDIPRGSRFLNIMSSAFDIRRIMERHGYSDEEHAEGLNLLYRLLGAMRPWEIGSWPSHDDDKKEKRDELLALYSDFQAAARTTLSIRYPAQEKYLFTGSPPLKGNSEAHRITVAGIVADRMISLRAGDDPRREACREEDRAAVELLDVR